MKKIKYKQMKKYLIFSIAFFVQHVVSGQNYVPIDTADFQQRKTFLAEFKTKNDVLIKTLKAEYSGKTGAELGKYYNEFYKSFEKEVKDKNFTFKSPFNEILNGMLSDLRKNYPQISANLNVLIAKDNTPNAYCLADGTFIINMGLFNWMDNDDQIASILSHEIAHKLKKHAEKAMVENINEEKSDVEKVKEIKNQSVNKTDKALDIIKNRLYKKRGKKRESEIEADSLGYVIYRNSDFKKAEFLNAMKNIRDFDSISPRELKIETYKKLYDLPAQPFKEKWMKEEDFSLYNYDFYKEKLDEDSLSTHPETLVRIAALEKEFPELKTEDSPKEGSEAFKNLQKIAKMEILPNLFQSEDYGVGIYVAMQMIQDEFEEDYVKKWLGKFYGKIYDGRKNYNLNRYLDRIDPKNQSESYRQFLSFMWNLSADEIKNIAGFYE
ncbi:MAG: M48 family metalloprotease [Flavobacteriaceae bacterium]|jgi:hypothetical protein|nr:M48 family metalloprotease [Flavobacteriaceae bacterium]